MLPADSMADFILSMVLCTVSYSTILCEAARSSPICIPTPSISRGSSPNGSSPEHDSAMRRPIISILVLLASSLALASW